MLPLDDLEELFLHTEISWRLFNNNKEEYLGNKMWKHNVRQFLVSNYNLEYIWQWNSYS